MLPGDVRSLAATSDGERLVLLDDASGEVVVVDVAARAVRGRCSVPTQTATMVVVTADGRHVLVVGGFLTR